MKSGRFVLLTTLLLFLAATPADDLDLQMKRFVSVYSIVEREAADPVRADAAIYQGAIPGMLRRLDPHSVFFDPGQFEQLKEMEHSTRKGFGAVVSILPGRVIVLQTMPGTPSAKSGIAPGDEILAVNNIALNRLDFDQLIGLLTESRQRAARVDVRRPGNARLMRFVMTPEEVDTPSIERVFPLRPGIGYIRVGSFDAKTGHDFHEAIEKLGGTALKGLVIDLRNNPGGLLPAALETAAQFLKPDTRILTIRGRKQKEEEITVPKGAQPYEFPVAVLMNEKSASASEIVAGALQDHDRGTIVGLPSFGKGLVQSVYPLSQSTGVALTTEFYYTPSGRSIQKHLAGQLDEATTAKAEQPVYKTDSGRIVQGGGGIQPDFLALPEMETRLRIALGASGVLPQFATEYARRHTVTAQFEATDAVLDEFRGYAAEHQIQPGINEWSQERDWIRNRLKQEIFNQTLGVAKGDEVEAERDPAIREALRVLSPAA